MTRRPSVTSNSIGPTRRAPPRPAGFGRPTALGRPLGISGDATSITAGRLRDGVFSRRTKLPGNGPCSRPTRSCARMRRRGRRIYTEPGTHSSSPGCPRLVRGRFTLGAWNLPGASMERNDPTGKPWAFGRTLTPSDHRPPLVPTEFSEKTSPAGKQLPPSSGFMSRTGISPVHGWLPRRGCVVPSGRSGVGIARLRPDNDLRWAVLCWGTREENMLRNLIQTALKSRKRTKRRGRGRSSAGASRAKPAAVRVARAAVGAGWLCGARAADRAAVLGRDPGRQRVQLLSASAARRTCWTWRGGSSTPGRSATTRIC